jgi:hypothetical protein
MQPPRLLPNPSCVVLVCEHQTRWWSGDRRVASASFGDGVSRVQRRRRRWAALDAEARLLSFHQTRLLSG